MIDNFWSAPRRNGGGGNTSIDRGIGARSERFPNGIQSVEIPGKYRGKTMLKRRDFLASTAALAIAGRPSLGLTQDRYEPEAGYGPRAALVIGNGAYDVAPQLDNPVNDARAVTGVLREIGFDVAHRENADFQDMRGEMASLGSRFPQDGVGLIYYAGHGVQVDGVNYLLPRDIKLQTVADLKERALNATELLNAANRTGAALTILVLDACRNNPFGDIAGASGAGLATMNQSQGETFIAFAAAAGKLAFDGSGANSPFTASLVSALDPPGQELFDVFRNVRRGVRLATGGKQIPFVNVSVERRFVFRLASAEPVREPEVLSNDETYWRTIRESHDPDDFKSFTKTYPDSPHVAEASQRLQTLEGQPSLRQTVPIPAGKTASQITRCEIEVDDPSDPDRATDGVHPAIVNTRLAIRLCSEALAEDLENPKLQYLLGRGLDITRRLEEAKFFFERAADGGYSAAITTLGIWYWRGRGDVVVPDLDKSVSFLQRGAKLGNPVAQIVLGNFYQRGLSVPESQERAVFWYEKAAAAKYPAALDRLAAMYRKGLGVPADAVRAAELYREAGELGNTNAIATLGRMYLDGKEIPRDEDRGIALLQQSTDLNNIFAPFHLGRLYQRGTIVTKNPQCAFAYYQLSAERGFAQAMVALGQMYEAGEGTPQDLEQAYFQYYVAKELAIDRGPTDTVLRDATSFLNASAANLTGAQRDRVEAEADGWIEMNIKKVEIARTFRTAVPGFVPTAPHHSLCGQPL